MKRILTTMLAISLGTWGAAASDYTVRILQEYPHDVTSYTQGLFFHKGKLYESTGQYGKSAIRTVDLKTGKAISNVGLSKKYFGEGSVIMDGKLYMLTWTNKVAFTFNPETLEKTKTYTYPREGWGLTTDGRRLIASDGSSYLYYLDADLKLLKKIRITTKKGRPVNYLNELEWIDGKIWANVYTTDMILIIDPDSGIIEGTVDCTGLLPSKLYTPQTDVLNGIATDAEGKIYLTGKNWPKLYQIELVPKKQGRQNSSH